MHGFEIKEKKEQKYWIKLIKCRDAWSRFFRVLASIQSAILTFNYF